MALGVGLVSPDIRVRQQGPCEEQMPCACVKLGNEVIALLVSYAVPPCLTGARACVPVLQAASFRAAKVALFAVTESSTMEPGVGPLPIAHGRLQVTGELVVPQWVHFA